MLKSGDTSLNDNDGFMKINQSKTISQSASKNYLLGNDSTSNLDNISNIKAKVETGLGDALGTTNKRIIKDAQEIMKNPIISAIKKTMQLSKKKNKKLEKDY